MNHRALPITLLAGLLLLPAAGHATVPSADDDVRFGPPWIAVEYPANPHHPSTRGATFMVRAYHHTEAIRPPMRAVAEGLVNGVRRTVPVTIEATHLPGVYAVRCDAMREGTWLIAVTLEEGPEATATALVNLDREGRVAAVDVPSTRTRDGWVVPRAVTDRDIESRLRDLERLRAAADDGDGRGVRHAGAGAAAGLLALALALGARRRRR